MKPDEMKLADDIWEKFKLYIPQKDHKKLARWLFDIFRERDAYRGSTDGLSKVEIAGDVHR